MENFIGQTFAWFTGVIEDINDPKEMGRVRVRCYGYHNADKVELPTAELPWATPMLPVTSASMTEVGQSATGLLEGSWVIGFFRDGPNAQDPVIMGSIPAISTRPESYEKGFTDPNQRYPVEAKCGVADTPLAAKSLEEAYKNSFSYIKKAELREEYDGVGTPLTSFQGTWDFPPIDDVIGPQYPKNHVISYEKADDAVENAHIVEFDVTPGKERISQMHRTGTYTEVTPDGSETQVITGKRYQVIAQGDNVFVKGGCNLTIEGGCRTKITGDWHIEVNGNKFETITGNSVESVVGLVTETYGVGQLTNIGTLVPALPVIGGLQIKTGGKIDMDGGGNIDMDAPNIFLN